MRTATAVATLLVVSMWCGDRTVADCQNGPVFPDTIRALDKNTIVWNTTMDVHYAKGDVDSLPTYTSWVRGYLAQSNALDISHDHPRPGQCAFYLLKSAGPPCGSWQSANGSEPDRDMLIEPPCSEVAPTDEELQSAVDGGLAIAPNPWGSETDFRVFYRYVQDTLGCTLEEVAPGTSNRFDETSPPQWNPYEFWCGLERSLFALELPAGPCLNRACFNHDSCYYNECAGGICAFSPQTFDVSCDQPLINVACNPLQPPPDGCLQADGLWWQFTDQLVCMVAAGIAVIQLDNELCQNPPCDDGRFCTNDDCADHVCVNDDTCVPGSGPCLAFYCASWGCDAHMPPDCDDGDPCTVGDYCQDFQCMGGSWYDCNDGNSCTSEYCDSTTGCIFETLPDGSGCDDLDACTLNDTCNGGVCTGTPWSTCDDGVACTINDRCMNGVCAGTPSGEACDDGVPCTVNDRCLTAVCAGTPSDTACDDGVSCTADHCDGRSGCTNWDDCPSDGDMCTWDVCDRQSQTCTYWPIWPCP